MTSRVVLEACVDTLESALAAQAGGAGRLELCADLLSGGTTPSAGTIALVRERVSLPLVVLIRPRDGDFLYDSDELEVMRRDIIEARRLGADGAALGVLRADGTVDSGVTAELTALARPMSVTFHRAFDACPDLDAALDTLIAIGVDRVLTAGGAASALAGVPVLKRLVARARGRITILAGGSLDEQTVAPVVQETGVHEVHVRGTREQPSAMTRATSPALRKPAPAGDARLVTDAGRIRAMVSALSSGSSPAE